MVSGEAASGDGDISVGGSDLGEGEGSLRSVAVSVRASGEPAHASPSGRRKERDGGIRKNGAGGDGRRATVRRKSWAILNVPVWRLGRRRSGSQPLEWENRM